MAPAGRKAPIPVPDHIGMMSTERLLQYLDLIADAM